MKEMLYKLTRSSTNPAAMALTVRGLLVGIVPTVLVLAPIACSLAPILCFDTNLVNPAIDAIVKFVESALYVVAGVMFVVGLARKVVKGKWSAAQ